MQAYNCFRRQVDSANQVIVAARATNQTSDKHPGSGALVEEVISNVGMAPREVSADAGPLLGTGGRRSVRAVRGPRSRSRREQTRQRPGCAHRRPEVAYPAICHFQGPDATEVTDFKRGRRRYALRMQTVEPVFGQIKQGRRLPSVPVAGLEKVSGLVVVDLHTATTCSNCSNCGANLSGRARLNRFDSS